MNADRLLALYDRVIEAPNAIPRLRRFVLNLAVRGKLVDRDPDDESVSELLKRLAAEKARLVKAGEVRALKPSAPIEPQELPIEVPAHWAWLRLRDIGRLAGGMTPSKGRLDYWGGEVVWLSPKDIKSDEVYDSELKITSKGLCDTRLELFPVGSLFLVARSGILKRTFPVAINRVPAASNQDLKVLIPYLKGQERYLQIMFRGLTDFILSELVKTGTTVQSLKYAEFEVQPFPLPPLAEQHRIVAKVDELMALCDRLEVARKDRESRRDRLTAASLARLNRPDPDPRAFRKHAAFALENLAPLTTRPDQIKALRQTILNLAVRGRLVPQDANDEPIEGELAVADDRRRLVAEADRRADPRRQDTLANDAKWIVPAHWSWRGLADLVLFVDYRGKTPPKSERGIRLITAKNVRQGFISLTPEEFVSEQTYSAWMTRGFPNKGDVLFTTEAPMGNAAVVRLEEKFALAQRVICFQSYGAVDPDFLTLQLLSEPFQAILQVTATGLTAKGIKASKLKRLPIALPPIAEQRRIVTKVGELMALCDRLEASLATGEAARRHLLDALLHAALDPETHQLEAAE